MYSSFPTPNILVTNLMGSFPTEGRRIHVKKDEIATWITNNRSVKCLNTVFASAPRSVMDKLQRVMNAAARLVSDTRKYDFKNSMSSKICT